MDLYATRVIVLGLMITMLSTHRVPRYGVRLPKSTLWHPHVERTSGRLRLVLIRLVIHVREERVGARNWKVMGWNTVTGTG